MPARSWVHASIRARVKICRWISLQPGSPLGKSPRELLGGRVCYFGENATQFGMGPAPPSSRALPSQSSNFQRPAPAHPRHHEVRDDQGGKFRSGYLQAIDRVAGNDGSVSIYFKDFRQSLRGEAVVLDNQDGGAFHKKDCPRLSSARGAVKVSNLCSKNCAV